MKHTYRTIKRDLLAGLILMSLGGMAGAQTATVIPDPAHGHNPLITESANGITVVNIKTPNQKGLSHNQYKDLQVGKGGLIFNNSGTISQTKLAGYISGNPYMKGTHASVILNEVTGTNPSRLQGYMESAGHKASLIIANPNGIYTNNAGFINVNRGILTTGRPIFQGENLSGFQVSHGIVTVEGKGFDGKGAGSVDILAEAVKLNAKLAAQHVTAVTGDNTIDTDGMSDITPAAVHKDNERTGVGLDASAIGGMYAGSIILIGTEKGLGVNNGGELSATEGSFIITTEGKLVNKGKLYAKGNLSIKNTDDIRQTDTGTMASGGRLDIASQGTVQNGNLLVADKGITVKANEIDNTGNTIESGGPVEMEAAENIQNGNGTIQSTSDLSLTAKGRIVNTQGTLQSGNHLTVSGDEVTGDGNLLAGKDLSLTVHQNFTNTGSVEAERNMTIHAAQALINAKDILANGHMAIEARRIQNTDKAQIQAGAVSMKSTENLINTGLINGKDIHLQSDTITNEDTGRVYGDQISIAAKDLNNMGKEGGKAPVIAARDSLDMGIAGTLTNAEHALLLAEGNLTIGGTLDGEGRAVGTAGRIENKSAYIEGNGNVTITAGTIQNTNEHFSVNPKVLTDTTHFKEVTPQGQTKRYELGNKGDKDKAYIQHEGYIDYLYTPDGGRYDHFNVYDYDRNTYRDQIQTTDPAHITSGRDMVITTGTVINDKSVITAGQTLHTQAKDVQNIDAKGNQTVENVGTATNYYTKSVHHGLSVHKRTETRTTAASYHPADIVTDITVLAAEKKEETKPETSGTRAEDYQSLAKDNPMTLPNSSLYEVNQDPDAKVLIETDPAFTDKKTWLSSDYFFRQMQYDPDHIQKRLGDGYYETQRIKNEVMRLTGKRFLEGYATDEDEYKALMDAGIQYAKDNGTVKIGVALTADQQKALKKDMVWLVETSVVLPNGKIIKALIPAVYLAGESEEKSATGPAVVSGSDIDFHVVNTILNEGTILSGNVASLSATNINNHGGTISGSDAALKAVETIQNTGLIAGTNSITLTAGKDIQNTAETRTQHNEEGSTTNLSKSGTIAVTGDKGRLTMTAGRDVVLTASNVVNGGKDGTTDITAGRNLTMNTLKTGYDETITWDGSNKRHEAEIADTGASITAKGNLTLKAGKDFTAKAAQVTSEGNITVKAGRNISINGGEDKRDLTEGHKHKSHGFLSTTTETTHDEARSTGNLESLISGNTVTLTSGGDTTVKGSTVISDDETRLTAGGNVNIESAQERDGEIHDRTVKKSGLLGGGLGFTIGSERKTDNYDNTNVTQAASTVGSVKGNVTIQAGKNVNLTASDLAAKKDVTITGEKMSITSKDNVYHSAETHEYKRTGLSVSLGGGAVNAAAGIAGTIQHGAEVSDKRLSALYGYEASKEIREGGDTIRQALSGKGGIGLSVGFGSSKSKTESHAAVTQAAASHVTAEGDVNVTATKDITIRGSDISGKDVNLKAGGNVNISSAEQTRTNTTNQSSKGGSLGVTFGGGLPVTVNGNMYSGKEKEHGTEITHRGSTVTADQKLTVESGKDTNILGSKAEGKKAAANIGGNLHIQSEQERNDYDSHSSSMGGEFGTDIISGHTSGNAGVGQGKIDSRYQSVTDQAGIYAGSEGFNITVKGNTDLKGAVIDSRAPAEKNQLTTGTLTWEDTGNKADYKANGAGVSYAGKDAKLNARGLTPNIAPTVKGNADSTTKSAVAEGTVTITNTKDQKQNVSDLNRDTKNTLNKLKEIFDKNKVQEKQEFIGLLSKDLNEAIHKVADQNHWADGSKEKVALHAIVSGMLSEMSGAGFNSGALAGGVNEYVIGYLKRTKHEKWMEEHPDLVEWLSTAVGGAIGKSANGDGYSGASETLSGTKWNAYGERPTYEGAFILTPDGAVYQVINGSDIYVGDESAIPENVYFWVQDPDNPSYGWDYKRGNGMDHSDTYTDYKVSWAGYFLHGGKAYGLTILNDTKGMKKINIQELSKAYFKAAIFKNISTETYSGIIGLANALNDPSANGFYDYLKETGKIGLQDPYFKTVDGINELEDWYHKARDWADNIIDQVKKHINGDSDND